MAEDQVHVVMASEPQEQQAGPPQDLQEDPQVHRDWLDHFDLGGSD